MSLIGHFGVGDLLTMMALLLGAQCTLLHWWLRSRGRSFDDQQLDPDFDPDWDPAIDEFLAAQVTE